MIATTHRPKHWNDIIGQEQPIRVLHSLLRNKRFMTCGYIFRGPFGVGKTTAAYLFARALMCQGDDPLGCGHCSSCTSFDDSRDSHPSFREIDAASHSGVQNVRDMMSQIDGPALIGRWVILVDEAHNLSPEAWDAFLKPLESLKIDIVFIFVTSNPDSIPVSIKSRCASLSFGSISIDDLRGLMMVAADKEGLRYTQDGLREIARLSNGRPRDALKSLALVGASGMITPASVAAVLDLDTDTRATAILETIVCGEEAKAVTLADELAGRIGVNKFIEAVFVAYSHDLFSGSAIAARFTALRDMSKFFLEWSVTSKLPLDIIPLFVMELSEMRLTSRPVATRRERAPANAAGIVDPLDEPISAAEARLLIAKGLRR